MMRSYLKKYVIALLVLLMLVVGLNSIVDPYDYFKIISFSKINKTKVVAKDRRREALSQISKEKNIHTLILGSSRSLMGMNEAQFSPELGTIVNASFERPTFYEIYRYFQYAVEHQPDLKCVILTLDFFSFNAYLKPVAQFDDVEDFFSGGNGDFIEFKNKLKALTSMDALLNSFKTIKYNIKASPLVEGMGEINMPDKFEQVERSFLDTHVYFPLPFKKFEFINEDRHIDFFEYFKDIVYIAKTKNIDLKLVILPMHARKMLLLKEIGLWGQFEYWKKTLVQLAPPFKLYDFAYFLAENLESPYELEDMHWHESLHFKLSLGAKVSQSFMKDCPDEFGIILSENNINQVLNNMNLDLKSYEQNYSLDSQSIYKTAKLIR